ncbi:MAG: PadR family transcriptional regulator [Gemmatimonadota bacterium]|jgi:DNA-binding PadR family transcriptional regulator
MTGTTPPGHEPLTPAVLHVLLSLSQGPRHGYAVMRAVEEDSGIEMGPGTVYGSLQRLEEAGLVEEVEAPAGGEHDGRRRYWALTPEGSATLRAEGVRLERLSGLLRERRILTGGET